MTAPNTTEWPLAIGRGLDRATGKASVQPQYPVDARNIQAQSAKMSVRSGMADTGFPPLVWGTHILEIIPIKATGDDLFVVFDSVSRDIRIYRLYVDGSAMQELAVAHGKWGTVNINADFPVISWAESDGKVMLAHAEDSISLRLQTIYYTPNWANMTLPGTLTGVTADLDGAGAAAVYFRGVYTHLVYMCGYGYGSASDPDRGDTLRFSQPGDPVTFKASAFVLFGVKRDPIVAAGLVDSGLVLAKENETWMMDGLTGSQFVPRLLDSNYGAKSLRGMISYGQSLLMYSEDGPRSVTSANTMPIGKALELTSPLPDSLPAFGPTRLCFAVADVERYTVEWLFPDVEAVDFTRVTGIMLSLYDPQDPRWTFTVRELPVICGGLKYGTDFGGAPAAPVGYPSATSAGDV